MTKRANRMPPPKPVNDDNAMTNAIVTMFDVGCVKIGAGWRFGIVMRFDIGGPQQLQMQINDISVDALPDMLSSIFNAVGVDRASAVAGIPCRVVYDAETGIVRRIVRFLSVEQVDLEAKVKFWGDLDKVTPASKAH